MKFIVTRWMFQSSGMYRVEDKEFTDFEAAVHYIAANTTVGNYLTIQPA